MSMDHVITHKMQGKSSFWRSNGRKISEELIGLKGSNMQKKNQFGEGSKVHSFQPMSEEAKK